MDSAPGAHVNGAAKDLLEPAWQMRWRVPELALMFSDRAVAQARVTGDRSLRLRAEALALFASNRLGQGATATHRAIAAVRAAEAAADDDVVAWLRVELAACARGASSHEVALRILDPVLERERIDPVVRANALLELASVLPSWRRDGDGVEALDEADRLFVSSDLERDASRLWRARVTVARACYFRRSGDFTSAVQAADSGLALLAGLGDPQADSGELSTRLVLERVHALLDLGHRTEAVKAAGSIVGQPVRAAGALPSGWLRLALATRVHLPEGEHGLAVWLLNEAAADAERHNLDGLLAEVLGSISHVHERAQDFKSALSCLRGAHAADRRWRSVVHNARLRLSEEFPGPGTVSRGAAAPAGTVAGTGNSADVPPAELASAQESSTGVVSADVTSTGVASEDVASAEMSSAGVTSAGVTVSPPESVSDEASSENEESRPRRRRSGSMDAEAARRLVETLTNRAAERSAQEQTVSASEAASSSGRRAMPEPRVPEAPEPWASEEPELVDQDPVQEPTAAQSHLPPENFPAEESASPPASDPADEVAKLLEAIRAESAAKSGDAQQWPAGHSSEPETAFPRVGGESDGSAGAGFDERWAREAAETPETAAPAPSATPDVTTILPTIPAMPKPENEPQASPEPDPPWRSDPLSAGWPRTDPHHDAGSRSERRSREESGLRAGAVPEDGLPQHGRNAEEPVGLDEPFRVFEPRTGGFAAHAAPDHDDSGHASVGMGETATRGSGRTYEVPEQWSAKHSVPAVQDPAAQEWFDGGRAAPELTTGGFDQEPAPEEPGDDGGRRSKGKSLAEIRASLRLVQDAEQDGRRRAKHADPEDEPEHAAGGEPAGELLARYGQWFGEQHAANEPEPEPRPAPEPEREMPADVGLADLLAEALMAYQNVGVEDSGSGSRHTSEEGGRRRAVPDTAETGTRSRHAQPSTADSEAALARHRRATMDSGGFNPQSWSSSGN